jgi:N-acyl-D-aspartate/D-glutamate deacylase
MSCRLHFTAILIPLAWESLMAIANLPSIYDAFLDYLVEKATPQEILAFKVTDDAENRMTELLERQNAGVLTPDEATELEHMRRFDSLVSVLKAKALEAMSHS